MEHLSRVEFKEDIGGYGGLGWRHRWEYHLGSQAGSKAARPHIGLSFLGLSGGKQRLAKVISSIRSATKIRILLLLLGQQAARHADHHSY